MDWKYLYTSFDGRINRKPYWLVAIVLGLVMVAVSFLIIGPVAHGSPALGVLLGLVLDLAVLYAVVALGVKRLHDRGKSWHFMVVFVAPGLLYQLGELFGITRTAHMFEGQVVMLPNTLAMILSVVSLVVGIWALVELGIRKGTAGDNAYGPDPLGGTAPQAEGAAD